MTKEVSYELFWPILVWHEFNLQTGRPVCMSFTLEGRGEHNVPIPSNVNLKKERPFFIFFTLEGHGGLNLLLHINVQIIYCLVNYGVVLLLVVVLKCYTTKTTIYAARAASPKSPSTTSPIPSNVNLQKERPVCMSFTFEGHGDHYVK
ncbi:hypothetical protein DAPPUDRAFT_235619 [Daphnia pulex]|uniref:Uncharacterized protein n=1 Tax=Daphnia pulex TaxID=6669 RepID=E9G0C3_DAPPU|nr:hypothetical protein DAPPUDRAFT_235619 [Daphnia pulex]|eukprot:EFX86882.1 hypothetical protein DAPPUDRAFT_235619 [Daphnia pulex]